MPRQSIPAPLPEDDPRITFRRTRGRDGGVRVRVVRDDDQPEPRMTRDDQPEPRMTRADAAALGGQTRWSGRELSTDPRTVAVRERRRRARRVALGLEAPESPEAKRERISEARSRAGRLGAAAAAEARAKRVASRGAP